MQCFECSEPTPAVAVCARCGAGLCRRHVVEGEERLTYQAAVARRVPVTPPARRLLCGRCALAERARATRTGAAA